MPNVDLPTSACWTSASAKAIFRTEALEGNEAVFLATHTPIQGFTVSGSEKEDIAEASEQGLLSALSLQGKRHAFCAIQGEPGSGKSHLIRWLYINWPEGDDLPILLQRSDGSLQGALQQLKTNLPARFLPLFDRIGQRQKATEIGRAAVFHNTLTALLRHDHYDPPLEDQKWCAQWNPSSLLFSERALSEWKAPARLLRLISGEGERNSASARFDIFDVAELVQILCSDGIAKGPGVALLAKLIPEAETIVEERGYGQSADSVVREFGSELAFTNALVDALNRRKNDAIQNVLGVSAEGLKALFKNVRSELKKDGTRLVLLLEDITSWEGLDDSLIDVLVTNASTRDASSSDADLCDLISVVGLTPQYMRTLKANYRQRITHEICLGEGAEGELQDVVTVREPQNRLRFVTQYLAATRAKTDDLDQWRDDLRHGIDRRPPNKCDDCVVREGCHKTFGDLDGVGLFPFTENAVAGFYEALKEDDDGMTWKTPRGLIQAVLSPTLSHPETLSEGQYPGPHIERSTFTEQSRHLSGALTSMIEAQVESPDNQARLRRIFTFWGAGGRAEVTRTEDGDLAFHNVPEHLFVSFQAPWLGSDVVAVPADKDGLQSNVVSGAPDVVDPITAPSEEVPGPLEDEAAATQVPEPTAPQAPTQVTQRETSSEPGRPSPVSRLKLNPDDIRVWKSEPDVKKLRNPAMWNRAVHLIVQGIEPRRVGANAWLWERFLTQDLVKLEGTSKETAYHFVVPAADWVFVGLEAYAVLTRKDLQVTASEVEYYRRRLARMIRHLEGALSSFFDKRLSLQSDGTRWDPAAAAAEVLLVRAWLRRATLPTDVTQDQWAKLLSDETGAESNPKSRTQAWQVFLDATSRAHSDLRVMLRRMIATTQGGAPGFGLASGSPAKDLVRLMRDGVVSPAPASAPTQSQANKVVEVAAEHLRRLEKLPDMVAHEGELISNRAKRLSEMLRGRAVKAHADRIDAAISQADSELSSAAPDRVRTWKEARDRIRPIIDDAVTIRSIEDIIYEFVDDAENLPAQSPQMLSKLIVARAGALDTVREAFVTGEAAIDALLVHVQAAVKANPVDGAGLAGINDRGRRLLAAAELARSNLRKGQG